MKRLLSIILLLTTLLALSATLVSAQDATPTTVPTAVAPTANPPCLPKAAPEPGTDDFGKILITVNGKTLDKFYGYYKLTSVTYFPGAFCQLHGKIRTYDEATNRPGFNDGASFDITTTAEITTMYINAPVFVQFFGKSTYGSNEVTYLLDPANEGRQNGQMFFRKVTTFDVELGEVVVNVEKPTVTIEFAFKTGISDN